MSIRGRKPGQISYRRYHIKSPRDKTYFYTWTDEDARQRYPDPMGLYIIEAHMNGQWENIDPEGPEPLGDLGPEIFTEPEGMN